MKKLLILAVCAVVCCSSAMAANRQFLHRCVAVSKGKVPERGSTLALVFDGQWAAEGTEEYREQCDFLAMAIGAVKSKGYKVTDNAAQADHVLLISHGGGVVEIEDGYRSVLCGSRTADCLQKCVHYIAFSEDSKQGDSYGLLCFCASDDELCMPAFSVFDRVLIGAAIDKGLLLGAPQKVKWVVSDEPFLGVSKRTMKKMRKYREKYRSFRYE